MACCWYIAVGKVEAVVMLFCVVYSLHCPEAVSPNVDKQLWLSSTC